jgi:hypothetical protein
MALKILMGRCTSESEVAPSADVKSALWGHLPVIGHPQFAGASHGAEVAARAAARIGCGAVVDYGEEETRICMNNRDFTKRLQAIARGEIPSEKRKPPVQEPPPERERTPQKEREFPVGMRDAG